MKAISKLRRLVFFIFLSGLPFFFLGVYAFKVEPRIAAREAADQDFYDAIIVPGIPFEGDSMSFIMRSRVLWAVHLFKTGITRNIIFSGGAVYTPYTESKIMAKYAQALGVPEQHILIESKAEHSTENVYYSYHLARELGLQKIALATDPIQSMFMKIFIMRKHLQISTIPIDFKIVDSMARDIHSISIDPVEAYVEEFTALPERENFFQRFRGTLGLRLNK